MKVFVKTTSEKILAVNVSSTDTVLSIKQQVQAEDSSLDPQRYRVLYQGKFLQDGSTVGQASIGENHTLLLVAAAEQTPAQQQQEQQQQQAYSQGHPWAAHRRHPHHHHPFLPLPFTHTLDTSPPISPPSSDDEAFPLDHAEMGLDPSFDFDSFDARVGGQMDVLMGIGLGFMLGCVAGLCLVEMGMGLSRRLKLGVLLGICCNVAFTLMRVTMVTLQP